MVLNRRKVSGYPMLLVTVRTQEILNYQMHLFPPPPRRIMKLKVLWNDKIPNANQGLLFTSYFGAISLIP